MIPSRASGTTWALRRDLKEYVTPAPDDLIEIYFRGTLLTMDRPTARLLAKRINQCLDATRKR